MFITGILCILLVVIFGKKMHNRARKGAEEGNQNDQMAEILPFE